MQAIRALSDITDLLGALDDTAIPFAVIGGCAVGAYAHLRGEAVVSQDLDIYVAEADLSQLLASARGRGATVVKRPQPRSVPVAVLEWFGMEVNALTTSMGLGDPADVIARAREFVLHERDELSVPVADPFDLLANKLAVGREKDRPHIAILKRFLEEEVVDAFETATGRARYIPANRLKNIYGLARLPKGLFDRMVAVAAADRDRRFLVMNAPSRERAERVISEIALKPLRDELRALISAD